MFKKQKQKNYMRNTSYKRQCRRHLDHIVTARQPKCDMEFVMDTTYSSVLVLVRLGYSYREIIESTGVNEYFLESVFSKLGLNMKYRPNRDGMNAEDRAEGVQDGKQQEGIIALPQQAEENSIEQPRKLEETITQEEKQQDGTTSKGTVGTLVQQSVDKALNQPSKLESFMKTVTSIKEERMKNHPPKLASQNTLHVSDKKQQTSWLSKSKVSLSDNEIEDKQVEGAQPSEPKKDNTSLSKRSTRQSDHIDSNIEAFQNILNSRLRKVASTRKNKEYSPGDLTFFRGRIIADVNNFFNKIESLTPAELTQATRSNLSPNNTKENDTENIPIRTSASLPPTTTNIVDNLVPSIDNSRSASTGPAKIIDDSFMKMTRSKTQAFTPYKPLLPRVPQHPDSL